MSQQSCTACNDLREYAPEFVVNGVTETVCENLADNKGLSAADGHTDCEDLHDVNDCLIGNMDDELDSFDVCEWKDFMHQYVPNDFETNKAMICSLCGAWDNIECLNKKMDAITFTPVVRAFRNGDNVHYTDIDHTGDLGTLKVYIDADGSSGDSSPNGTYGSQVADRDYIAMVTWCATGYGFDGEYVAVQVSLRNSTQSQAYGDLRSQHFSVEGVKILSENQSGFCYLPKGSYLLVHQNCSEAHNGAHFRVHQFSMVLIPVVTGSIEC